MALSTDSILNPYDSSFLIVGVARNCQHSLKSDVSRISNSIPTLKENRYWLVIESDSSDQTLSELQTLTDTHPNFRFISMGVLSERMPIREERIAFCRNVYLKEIKNNPAYRTIDYVVVADLDGINNAITLEGFVSCWGQTNWEVCTANQVNCYYDIFALRHPIWNPICPWRQAGFLEKFEKLNKAPSAVGAAVYAKMIKIPKNSEWIEVDSAFGGLAIYKKEVLNSGNYSHLDQDGYVCCEHVSLHNEIRKNGGKIYINPTFINAQSTEHDLPGFWSGFWSRQYKSLKKRLNWIRQRF
jgi:hypothetical protein